MWLQDLIQIIVKLVIGLVLVTIAVLFFSLVGNANAQEYEYTDYDHGTLQISAINPPEPICFEYDEFDEKPIEFIEGECTGE